MTGMKPAVTFFADYAATEKHEECLGLHELADLIRRTSAPEKAALPWLKLARFGNRRTEMGSLRHNSNLEAVFGIEADYDGGKIPLETVVDAVKSGRGGGDRLHKPVIHTQAAALAHPLSDQRGPPG